MAAERETSQDEDSSRVDAETQYSTLAQAPFDLQCDALARLTRTNSERLHYRIFTILRRICQQWWESIELVWSNRPNAQPYATMRFTGAYLELARMVASGTIKIPDHASQLYHQEAAIVIVQMIARIIVCNHSSPPRHLEKSPEACSKQKELYEAMTLAIVQCLPWTQLLYDEIREKQDSYGTENQIGIDLEDVLDGQGSAAPRSPSSPSNTISTVDGYQLVADTHLLRKLKRSVAYFTSVKYMKGESLVSIKASILEAHFYTELLKSKRNELFPATLAAEKDLYLDYIPPMFTFESTYFEQCVPPIWLFNIMLWSMFIFLVDEYMEATVVQFSMRELQCFRHELEKLHPSPDPRLSKIIIAQSSPSSITTASSTIEHPDGTKQRDIEQTERVKAALDIYMNWAAWCLHWDRLELATVSDKNNFRYEIKQYLLYHVHQIEDNKRLAEQQGRSAVRYTPDSEIVQFQSPRTNYPTWVHTVGGGHISAPVSLAFAACYMGSWIRHGRDGWTGIMQKFFAYETNIHVAAYCRMYNDYGSIKRDANECNLNSINFPEFWTDIHQETNQAVVIERIKGALLEVAKHERQMADILGAKFYESLHAEGTTEALTIASCMKVYFRSGELFSDMYLTRDVTNSVK